MCRGVSHTPFTWAIMYVCNEYAWFVWGTFHLKLHAKVSLLLLIYWCNGCKFIVWAKMCRGVSHTPSSERWCMSAMNMPYSFQWHVRPREGVCDTPLHLFDWNFGAVASIEGLICPHEGVCDTPTHMFGRNRGVVASIEGHVRQRESVCDTHQQLFD